MKYTKSEQQINDVLSYQDKLLSDIHFPENNRIDKRIKDSISLLNSLGYASDIPEKSGVVPTRNKTVLISPSWEKLVNEAEKCVGTDHTLEELFSPEELMENRHVVRVLNEEYNTIHKLDKTEMGIAVAAGLLGAVIDILLVGIPKKTNSGLKAGPLSNYIRDYFDKKYPEAEMNKLAGSQKSKVPYDAQDNRHTNVYVDGLSPYYHRLLQLGHDPLLGFLVGVVDILNGTMTTIDKKGQIVCQVMENYADRKEADIFAALCKQINHLKSDVTTSMGLPVPLMSFFNLFQFGNIGEENLTIAEMVQGMYYEGYDFIHFCSMSIPAMITEVVVRLGYMLKRINEGHSIKDSIPFSLNREKNPKLATMLFIGHSASIAVNTGKILFTNNPMAINYPQWIAFAKYSYQQLKWGIIQKPSLRRAFVLNKIDEELDTVLVEIDKSFDKVKSKYIVIID